MSTPAPSDNDPLSPEQARMMARRKLDEAIELLRHADVLEGREAELAATVYRRQPAHALIERPTDDPR